jgi:hypothetical protein
VERPGWTAIESTNADEAKSLPKSGAETFERFKTADERPSIRLPGDEGSRQGSGQIRHRSIVAAPGAPTIALPMTEQFLITQP